MHSSSHLGPSGPLKKPKKFEPVLDLVHQATCWEGFDPEWTVYTCRRMLQRQTDHSHPRKVWFSCLTLHVFVVFFTPSPQGARMCVTRVDQMAWRWEDTHRSLTKGNQGTRRESDDIDVKGISWLVEHHAEDFTHGYSHVMHTYTSSRDPFRACRP